MIRYLYGRDGMSPPRARCGARYLIVFGRPCPLKPVGNIRSAGSMIPRGLGGIDDADRGGRGTHGRAPALARGKRCGPRGVARRTLAARAPAAAGGAGPLVRGKPL